MLLLRAIYRQNAAAGTAGKGSQRHTQYKKCIEDFIKEEENNFENRTGSLRKAKICILHTLNMYFCNYRVNIEDRALEAFALLFIIPVARRNMKSDTCAAMTRPG